MSSAPEIEPMFRQALRLHKQGSVKRAKSIYAQILEVNPAHFDSCHLLGVAHIQTGSPERAVDLISKALTMRPDYADAHYNLGQALRSLGRMDDALGSFGRAVALMPACREYHIENGKLLHSLGRYEEALTRFDEALQLHATCLESHCCKAGVLARLGRLDEGLSLCDRAIMLQPGASEPHLQKGKILRKSGRLQEALASYDKAIQLNPRSPEPYYLRSKVLRQLDRPQEALASCDKAIHLDHHYAEAYTEKARILTEMELYADALASSDCAIAAKASSAEAHIQKGYALGHLGRLDAAAESFDAAIKLERCPGVALSGRAWLHALSEKWDLALQDLESAYTQDPTSQGNWQKLAALPEGYLTAERASEILQRLRSLPERSARASELFLEAGLLRHLNRHQESFEILTRANELRQSEVAGLHKWRLSLNQILDDAERWKPRQSVNDAPKKLLVILGPSRGGKTSLESLICGDKAIKRGYEGAPAGTAIRQLSELWSAEAASNLVSGAAVSQIVFAALFQSRAAEMLSGEHEVASITNPFLLNSAHMIFDLLPKSYFIFVGRDSIDNAAEIFATDYRSRYPFAYSAHDALSYVRLYQSASDILLQKMGRRAMKISFEQLMQPTNVVSAVYEMMELNSPRELRPTVQLRNARSVYRENFSDMLTRTTSVQKD